MISTFLTLLTIADWINSITAIAALLTAIVTFVTVKEIKKQREHSYHPDINLANIEFYVYRYDYEKEVEEDEPTDNTLSLYFSKQRLSETEIKNGYNELTIEINNIGLGVAKHVYWDWEVNFKEIESLIRTDKEPFIVWNKNEDDLLISSEKLNVDWSYFISEENFRDYFNFILPYSIENRKNEIRIPSSYIDLYWLYKAKEFIEEKHEIENIFPPLRLNVKYTNIHGKEIKKIFLLFIRWNFMGNPILEQSEMAKFRFEILELE